MSRRNLSVAFSAHVTLGDLLILLSTVNWAIYSILGTDLRTLGPRAHLRAMLFGALSSSPLLAQRGWRGAPPYRDRLDAGVPRLAAPPRLPLWYGALERIEVSRVAALLYPSPHHLAAQCSRANASRSGDRGSLLVLATFSRPYAPERRVCSFAALSS